jgi:hypothetical protein
MELIRPAVLPGVGRAKPAKADAAKDDHIRRCYLELAVAYDRLAEARRLMGFLSDDWQKRPAFCWM